MTRRIDPVQVLGDDEEWTSGRLQANQVAHDLGEDPAGRLRIEPRRCVAEDVEQQSHGGVIEVQTQLPHPPFDAGSCDRFQVSLPDAKRAAEQARQHRVGCLPIVGAASRHPAIDAGAEARQELRDQPAFADPGLAGHGHGAALAEDRSGQRLA